MKPNQKKLIQFHTQKKRMPSYSELATLYGYRSKNAAYNLAAKFITQGILKKDTNGILIPGESFKKMSVLGSVQAGFPGFANQVAGDELSLDEWLVNDHDATYILKVSGDSMINAGILEGDYVIVERTQKFSPGDIVIAEVNNEWTMKYLRAKGARYYLEAANENYPDIYPEEDLRIHAVVRSVARKYD